MLNLRRTFSLIVMWLCLVAASPQTPNPKHVPTVVPNGVIFVKGAEPSSSDTTTPLPENGSVAGGRYRNAYFGLAYPIPQGWTAQPAGPPPSDGGSYVLAQFALSDTKQQRQGARSDHGAGFFLQRASRRQSRRDGDRGSAKHRLRL